MYIIGHPLLALTQIASGLITLYCLIIIASAVLSFIPHDRDNILVRIIHQLTYPAYSKIRNYIPTAGGLDLTPLALIVGLQFIQQGILPIFTSLAIRMIAQ